MKTVQDLEDSKQADAVRGLDGALLIERPDRISLRQADLLDEIWHPYDEHLRAFAMTGEARCFCVQPGKMIEIQSPGSAEAREERTTPVRDLVISLPRA